MMVAAFCFYAKERIFCTLRAVEKSVHAFIVLILLFFCYCEWRGIQKNGEMEAVCSGLIFFIPICIYFFELFLIYGKTICLPYVSFRKLSQIIYFCPVPIGTIIGYCLHIVFHRNMNTVIDSIFRCFCTLIICYIIYFLENSLKKHTKSENQKG